MDSVQGAPSTGQAAGEATMPKLIPVVPTVGEIARRIGQPLHRVEYVIRARGILPAGRAGNARVFTEADVVRIESELQRIARDKEASTEFDR